MTRNEIVDWIGLDWIGLDWVGSGFVFVYGMLVMVLERVQVARLGVLHWDREKKEKYIGAGRAGGNILFLL